MGFWSGKNVFLTGHTGFKGSWLTLWLKELGANVTGYALPPATTPSIFELLDLKTHCQHHEGDIRDLSRLKTAIAKTNPDIVIHMAAQALVLESYADPVGTFATNVMGTVNVLEASRGLSKLQTIVNVTTDKVYENKEQDRGYRENERLGGSDPYSNSKACSELVSVAYRSSFYNRPDSPRVTSCRAGNVIGGGDWAANRLIPDAARALGEGRRVQIRNPDSIRPWQHVLEPLSGYLRIAELGYQGKLDSTAWNFGPDDDDMIPVGDVMNLFCSAWGSGAAWEVASSGEKKHETKVLKLDCRLAREKLKWAPRWPLKTALPATAEWYKAARQDPSGLLALTRNQISAYMDVQ